MHAKKKNGIKILLKIGGFLEPKHSKDEGRESWDYLKTGIRENIHKMGYEAIIFQSQRWSNGRKICGLKMAMQFMHKWKRWGMMTT